MTVSINQWSISLLQLEYDDEPDDSKDLIINTLPDRLAERCDVIVALWPTGSAILKDRYGKSTPGVSIFLPPKESKQ